MKKILYVSIVVMAVFGIVGIGSATPYSYTENLDTWIWAFNNSVNFSIPITPDFQIPYDTLTSATLTITADNRTSGGDSYLTLTTTNINLNNWTGSNDNYSDTFNVASFITSPWNSGTPLNGTITNNTWFDGLWLESITLNMDYTNGSDPGRGGAPVPEPCTMLLLGSGLVGFAAYRKKFRNN